MITFNNFSLFHVLIHINYVNWSLTRRDCGEGALIKSVAQIWGFTDNIFYSLCISLTKHISARELVKSKNPQVFHTCIQLLQGFSNQHFKKFACMPLLSCKTKMFRCRWLVFISSQIGTIMKCCSCNVFFPALYTLIATGRTLKWSLKVIPRYCIVHPQCSQVLVH